MRIGIDTHSITSGQATGNRTYVYELVKSLVELDPQNEYVLYGIKPHPYYSQFESNPRVRIQFIFSPNGFVRNFISLPYVMVKDDLDVFHSQYILPPFSNVPGVLAVHDLYYSHLSNPKLRERIIAHLTAWSVNRANHIVTLSNYSKQDIVERCAIDQAKVSVIPIAASKRFAPITRQSVTYATRKKYGIQKDYILFLGRTEDPRKNLPLLLEAYSYLRSRKDIKEQLVIAGRHGAGTKKIIDIVRSLGLAADVIFTGIVDTEFLPVLISGAQVFVYISSFEGFGLPILEAMACGTPVITSNVTSLPEVAGNAAFLIRPDVGELINALHTVLRDKNLRYQMKENGLARANCFTWKKTALKTIQVYESVASAKPI